MTFIYITKDKSKKNKLFIKFQPYVLKDEKEKKKKKEFQPGLVLQK